ncbi:hypothetical protein FRC17_003874 [Serendipita sp. 399]|nr:hypothetical protein FRC17_003874 [Serendipita sp. 399]
MSIAPKTRLSTGAFTAEEFVISAGCVPLKPLPRGKRVYYASFDTLNSLIDAERTGPRLPDEYAVIYIRKRRNGDKVLAKGRKDVGEAIQEAAVRETFEETGYKTTVIELPTPSLAPGTQSTIMNQESIGITLKIDGISRKDKVFVQKFVFWWVSEVDCDESGNPVQRAEGTQLEYENYDVEEMSFESCLAHDGLTFAEDRRMVDLARTLLLRRHELAQVA